MQYILDSVVLELSKDPDKTFIYVEMAYFARWWKEQTEMMQSLVSNVHTFVYIMSSGLYMKEYKIMTS